jgi:outer membrane protein TolC
MNRRFYKIIGVVLTMVLIYSSMVTKGQGMKTHASSTSVLQEEYFPDLETQFVSVDTIVNVALKNSPFMKADSTAIDMNKNNVKLVRYDWLENISGFGNYAQGNQKFGVTGGPTDHQSNFLNGYRAGVNVNIPLSQFTTRKFRVRMAQAQVSSLRYQKQQTELEVKRQVVAEYNNVIAAQKVLRIKSESLENFRVLHQLAEKQFREGTIPLEDYAYSTDLVVKAETDYELAKSNFKTLYQQFEYLVGVKLTTLMRRR